MPVRTATAAFVAGCALVVSACGGGDDAVTTQTVTVTTMVDGPAPESTDSTSWTMPDLVGKNLQEAQDSIQALTDNQVFYTGSTDLTGAGREQVMDRNWQVCTSTPAPGETFTADTSIEFGVVKLDSESCP